jgi:3-phenylpropionate/trans-cinnamate dioxygenase ferredoxin reductase subunit
MCPWFWSDQYELTLQMAGVPEQGLCTVERDVGAEALLVFHLGPDGGVSGSVRPRSPATCTLAST